MIIFFQWAKHLRLKLVVKPFPMSVNRYTVFARRKTLNPELLYLVRFEAIHRLNLDLKEVLSTNELNLILVASAMDQFPVLQK